MNVLITSLSRKVPLLEAFRAALHAGPGRGAVWGADADPECVGRYFADRFWVMPRLDAEGVTQHVLSLCERERIRLLIPTRDGELAFFAGLRDELAEVGAYVPVGTREAIAVCRDKLSFHEHCRREGIPTPETSTTVEGLSGERFVVKERWGGGSRAIGVGLDRRAAEEYGRRLEDPIFQPLVAGLEHSVDLYLNRRGDVVDAAPRTRIRVHDGESTVTETVEHPALVEIAVRFAQSLELRGHLVIQAFVRGAEVTVIECNARVGGASTLGFYAGVDTPEWSLREARGETVPTQLGHYRRGLRLVRYPVDRLLAP